MARRRSACTTPSTSWSGPPARTRRAGDRADLEVRRSAPRLARVLPAEAAIDRDGDDAQGRARPVPRPHLRRLARAPLEDMEAPWVVVVDRRVEPHPRCERV